jgi:hypothetical protein
LTLLDISQIGISLFGSAAFLAVTREETHWQKVGVTLGLLSNPFWWMMVIATAQWITLPVHALYTYGWLRKAYVLWWR